MNKSSIIAFLAAITLSIGACGSSAGNQTTAADTTATTVMPTFNADSAYALVAAQCDMGPRVPGTEAHADCAHWLQERLAQWCDTVMVQQAPATTFDGNTFTISNIIGVINPDATQRLLLVAHWDCRPWADQDPDPSKRQQPVMGANDAASGVAVLLEMARIMHDDRPAMGIDILLVDLEDWGNENDDDSWALGTQYWAKHPHVAGYMPAFGILLDMVGAAGAQFAPEYHSMQYAAGPTQYVWGKAREAGHANYFVGSGGGAVTDDHVVINHAGIPCIDIIDMRNNAESGFFEHWHTTHDTMDAIDRATLRAVGETLVRVIYE